MQRLVATILAFYQTTNAANWAQVSGNIDQNTVVPNIPSPESRHWQARYGAVAIVEPTGNSTDFGRVLLMGGDTYDGDTTRRNYEPGLLNDKWENGYQNDVWAMDGTEWYIKGDIRVESGFGQKQPKVESRLQWTRSGLQSGLHPPPGVTNDEWILCEDFFRNERTAEENVDCEENPRDVQWSPRRHHAGVFFNDHFWVFGGRAREFVELPEERSIGGIIGPRVKDVPRNFLTEDQLHTTQREASIYKSDVWKSTNGRDWTLVTPGCKVPQDNVVAKGSTGSNRHGVLEQKCQTDSDCYGAEECRALDSNFPEELTCVCAMWSPREQHAVAVWNDTLYISGGYSSRLYSRFSACGEYACGDKDASAYRYFHSDVWSSKDGETWSRVAAEAWDPIYPGTDQRPGRGGHQMISIMDKNRVPFLWVFGGRGGDNTMNGGPEIYFNDMWRAPLPQGFPWTKIPLHDSEGNEYYEMPWSPRTGHTIALETPAPDNLNTRTLYLYGGFHEGTFLDDLWAWRLDDPQETWKRDFTPEALFSTGLGENYHFDNSSPTINYVTPDSDLSMLVRFWVPTDPDSVTGQRPEKRTLISSNDLATMKSQGLNSIRDLAEADLYTILRLRGFDIPQVPEDERLNVQHVCDYRALAIAVVDKCRLNKPSLYDSDFRMPWNIIPVFGGPPPPEDNVAWHGRDNYNELLDNVDDVEVLTEQWDGCEYIPEIQGLFGPNVNGIGFVDQVLEVRDPKFEIQELFCRQSPGPRAFHNMVWFEGRLYLMGGKKSESQFYADTWYRDSKLPVARIADGPRSRTPNEMFAFVADEAGSSFEYRIWDPTNFKEVRRWTAVVRKTDISWLDWRKGGPGNGYYQLYVRAVDPAGNRDERYIAGQNVYRWYYVSPTPWDIILATVFCFLFLCFLAYLEYRRRVKKSSDGKICDETNEKKIQSNAKRY